MSHLPKPLPPPEEVGRRVMARMRALVPEGLWQVMVNLGIYTPDGRLTLEYGGAELEPEAAE